MSFDFSTWHRDWSFESTVFGRDSAKLRDRLSALRVRHVVFCAFENRFAKSGGLAAVAVNTLPFLMEANHLESVSLLTPFYPFLMDEDRLEATGLRVVVPYGEEQVDVQILRNLWTYSEPGLGSVAEYYLKADGFFGARNRLGDPYLYVEDDPVENERLMLESALLYCAAAPLVLGALGLVENVILHLQEWQTTMAAFTAKAAMLDGMLKSCGTVQTMHNPYDCFVPKPALKKIVTSKEQADWIDALPGEGLTAYEMGLPLLDAPVATVSETFARELTIDVMQTHHFAPHLQPAFRNGVVGINNGPFVGYSRTFPKRTQHTIAEIRDIKRRARASLLQVLDAYAPPERFGELTYGGGSIVGLPEHVPILVMSGRLDPMQKGYDILIRALAGFGPDEIKVVLTPMAVRAGDLDYCRKAVLRYRGNLVVYPIRMKQGYLELQTGSTYGVMPSTYEPFGAAIEYMVNGTVTIARRTGGLVDQVIDGETGFLYREPAESYTPENIESYAAASADVQMREGNRWATDMADSLARTLRMATELYRDQPDEYYGMIIRGFEKASQFSWEKNATEYSRVYRAVSGAPNQNASTPAG